MPRTYLQGDAAHIEGLQDCTLGLDRTSRRPIVVDETGAVWLATTPDATHLGTMDGYEHPPGLIEGRASRGAIHDWLARTRPLAEAVTGRRIDPDLDEILKSGCVVTTNEHGDVHVRAVHDDAGNPRLLAVAALRPSAASVDAWRADMSLVPPYLLPTDLTGGFEQWMGVWLDGRNGPRTSGSSSDARLAANACENPPSAPPQRHLVRRDSDRDLTFDGWVLAESDTIQVGSTRQVTTKICLTVAGRLVTAVRHATQREGERERFLAAAHVSVDDAITWLRDDDGQLPRSAKQAWERACEAWEPLGGEATERVD